MAKYCYETILSKIGGFGCYQKLLVFLVCLIYIPLGYTIFMPVFIYISPSHRCFVPSIDEGTKYEHNRSVIRQHIPSQWRKNNKTDDDGFASCARFVFNNINNNGSLGVENCNDGWVYAKSKTTVVTDFDLVCESSWKKPFLTGSFMVGLLIGSALLGPISDKYGRRKTCLGALVVFTVSIIGLSLSPQYELLVSFYILMGVVHVILYGCPMVLGHEIVDSNHKAVVSALANICLTVGYLLLPLVAYLVNDWRWVTRTIGFVVMLFFPYYWWLPESPRWLLSQKREGEGVKFIQRIARVNGTTKELDTYLRNNNDEDLLLDKEEKISVKKNAQKREGNILTLAKNSVMLKRTLILCFIWNTCYLSYYTLGLNTSSLGGNNYVNCIIAAGVDFPCYFMVTFFVHKFGRRSILFGCFVFSGLFCLLSALLQSPHFLFLIMAMVGKFFATAAMGIIFLYTSELYPTNLRNTGMGVNLASSRISSIAAPFLVYAGENARKAIPFLVMGGLSLLAAILTLLLPETRKSSLPETMDEAVDLEQLRLSISCKKGTKPQKTQMVKPESIAESI